MSYIKTENYRKLQVASKLVLCQTADMIKSSEHTTNVKLIFSLRGVGVELVDGERKKHVSSKQNN